MVFKRFLLCGIKRTFSNRISWQVKNINKHLATSASASVLSSLSSNANPEEETFQTRLLTADVAKSIGKEIQLLGWVSSIRVMGSNHMFLVLRDHSGSIQLILKKDTLTNYDHLMKEISNVPLESVISVRGIVNKRPNSMINVDTQNGHYEVQVESIKVLNQADRLSFNPNFEENLPDEEVRLCNRFVDLRRPSMQKFIRLRAQINRSIRDFMDSNGFVEVETPILFKSTPEGAREFLVPADRIRPTLTFALPQSPQQFKQMLMAAGFDKYYQIARCFRNEDLRADRQPEFTQLDMEMSFATSKDVMNVMEQLVKMLWSRFLNYSFTVQFKRINFQEAIARFGSDKPDLRYPFELETVEQNASYGSVTEKLSLVELLSILKQEQIDELEHEITTMLPKVKKVSLKTPIIITRMLDDHVGTTTLGKIRNIVIRFIEKSSKELSKDFQTKEFSFLWVYDFPLFARASNDEISNQLTGAPTREYESMHHPFTAPHPNDIQMLPSKPLSVRGLHYDLVLNGNEIGGGSIRIHSMDLQKMILRDVIKLPDTYIQHFDHLFRALSSGCPPHGGIALGLDRLIAIMCNANSIRDVIAFPKNSQGIDLCVNAPN